MVAINGDTVTEMLSLCEIFPVNRWAKITVSRKTSAPKRKRPIQEEAADLDPSPSLKFSPALPTISKSS
jgi:hypothetical protein